MALTQEQTEYYNDLEDLFSMPGWKRLIEDAQAQIYQFQADALEQANWDSVNVLRGRALQLNEFTLLEEISLLQKAALEEDEDDGDV
jgi:hypothetical protein